MAINSEPHVHNVIICANIFVRMPSGKYLMLRRSESKKYAPGFVHPIGGKVDENEDPFNAAIREVKEEAGIEVENVRLEAVINEVKPEADRDENWLIFHFSADYKDGEVKKTDEGELIELSTDEIKHEKLFPSVKFAIDDILDLGKGTVIMTVEYIHGEMSSKAVLKSKNICSIW